ncbi:hypothetical protein SDC9_08922 [bioreactor metagenome]|uniref:Uncharacterized protein n=1 Tax=bioreactor metagenome TaxID=1076179 RepID=A0A644T8Z5_9ZZZZ
MHILAPHSSTLYARGGLYIIGQLSLFVSICYNVNNYKYSLCCQEVAIDASYKNTGLENIE